MEEINTEDEMATDTSKWSDKEHKKLQHMTKFHEEYQRVFGNRASLRTIIRKRIVHMNPPIPSSVCKEEMQDTNIDSNEVIVEYITDAKGNRIKKLMSIRKALAMEGENRTIHYLLHGEYELNNTSWTHLQQKYNMSHDTVYTALKGKRRPGGSQYHQKRRRSSKQEAVVSTSGQNI